MKKIWCLLFMLLIAFHLISGNGSDIQQVKTSHGKDFFRLQIENPSNELATTDSSDGSNEDYELHYPYEYSAPSTLGEGADSPNLFPTATETIWPSESPSNSEINMIYYSENSTYIPSSYPTEKLSIPSFGSPSLSHLLTQTPSSTRNQSLSLSHEPVNPQSSTLSGSTSPSFSPSETDALSSNRSPKRKGSRSSVPTLIPTEPPSKTIFDTESPSPFEVTNLPEADPILGPSPSPVPPSDNGEQPSDTNLNLAPSPLPSLMLVSESSPDEGNRETAAVQISTAALFCMVAVYGLFMYWRQVTNREKEPNGANKKASRSYENFSDDEGIVEVPLSPQKWNGKPCYEDANDEEVTQDGHGKASFSRNLILSPSAFKYEHIYPTLESEDSQCYV